jgi:hypothetical protein
MGERLADLRTVPMGADGFAPNASYLVPHPPHPNPDFPGVQVVAFPSTGVCEVVGVTSPFEADASGEKAMAFADHLAEVLKAKYGPYDAKKDDCQDSQESCDQTWTFELLEGRAKYAYVWNALSPERFSGIGRMQLFVFTRSAASPVVILLYDHHTKACDDAMSASDATGL